MLVASLASPLRLSPGRYGSWRCAPRKPSACARRSPWSAAPRSSGTRCAPLPGAWRSSRRCCGSTPPPGCSSGTWSGWSRWAAYRLEPGERVAFSLYLFHHDDRWWSEPGRFRPDRWLADTPAHAPRAYRPFGGGPRICAGAQLGMV
ncbi:cytochrome P450 [Streptomyces rochei]|uniref:cytochrome P450 n=1 Tax=Streptomyces rochei TaxID=1928 RepID=UPI003673BCD1